MLHEDVRGPRSSVDRPLLWHLWQGPSGFDVQAANAMRTRRQYIGDPHVDCEQEGHDDEREQDTPSVEAEPDDEATDCEHRPFPDGIMPQLGEDVWYAR